MATEGNVWSNDVGNGRLHLYWWLDGSTINWWLKFSKDDSNYRRLWNYAVYRNDSWIAGSSTQRDVYDGDTIDSGSFNISQLGSNGYLKFYIEGGIGQSSVNAQYVGWNEGNLLNGWMKGVNAAYSTLMLRFDITRFLMRELYKRAK